MDIRTEIKSGTECLADLLNIEVEQLRLDFPEIDEIIIQPTGKHIQKIAKKYGFKFEDVKTFLSEVKYEDQAGKEIELKTAVGEEVADYVEKYATKFIKENLPECWDKESEIVGKLTSPIPAIRKEAMRELLVKFDISSSHSITRISNTGCPPIVLQRIVEECVNDFIQKRQELNADFSFPSYFHAALGNDNLPRYVLVDAIKNLTDSEWILAMQREFGYKIAENMENFTMGITTVEKKEDPIRKEIEEKTNAPKPIKRIKDALFR